MEAFPSFRRLPPPAAALHSHDRRIALHRIARHDVGDDSLSTTTHHSHTMALKALLPIVRHTTTPTRERTARRTGRQTESGAMPIAAASIMHACEPSHTVVRVWMNARSSGAVASASDFVCVVCCCCRRRHRLCCRASWWAPRARWARSRARLERSDRFACTPGGHCSGATGHEGCATIR